MKIAICGSIAFYQEMLEIKAKLENLGHEIVLPPTQIKDQNGDLISVEKYYEIRKNAKDDDKWIWERKAELIKSYFQKEVWADAILVLNHDKNDIAGYIGGNTLMEMGVAFFLDKKIFLLNPIPEISYKEEILAMSPIVINQEISKIV